MPARTLKRSLPLCAVLLALAAAACRREPAEDDAAVREALAAKDTTEVLAEAAAAEYEPPADGRLTAAQLEMYLVVKRREQRIREVAARDGAGAAEGTTGGPEDAEEAAEDAAGALAADLRAAQDLGHNPKEYRWVGERVMEVLLSDLRTRLESRLIEGRERYVELLEAQKEKVTEPGQLARLDEQIAEARRDVEEQEAAVAEEPADEALAYNAALVARYRDRIEAVLTPDERFAVGEWEGEEPVEPPAGAAPEQP